jgi:tRNA synthetases class II (A)
MKLSTSRVVMSTVRIMRPAGSGRAGISMLSDTLKWPVEKVRSTFVEYFEKKQKHVHYRSSPVVPLSDPTLLFANAGMNQFKSIFLGTTGFAKHFLAEFR